MTVATWNEVFTRDRREGEPPIEMMPLATRDNIATRRTPDGERIIYAGSDEYNMTIDEEQAMYRPDDDNLETTAGGRPYMATCNCTVCTSRRERHEDQQEMRESLVQHRSSIAPMGPSDIDTQEIVQELDDEEEEETSEAEEEAMETFRERIRNALSL